MQSSVFVIYSKLSHKNSFNKIVVTRIINNPIRDLLLANLHMSIATAAANAAAVISLSSLLLSASLSFILTCLASASFSSWELLNL